MAIVESTFAARISAIAAIPEKEIENYEIYEDLTLNKKGLLRSFQNLLSDVVPQFSQVGELFVALKIIEAEIMRNDYAILRNEKVQKDLPKVFCNFEAIILHTGVDILMRIKAVQARFFAYLPIDIDASKKLEFSLNLRYWLKGYEIDAGFETLSSDVMKAEYAIPCTKTFNFFYRLMIYASYQSFFNAEVKSAIQRQINSVIDALSKKPILNDEEKLFLDRVFTDPLFLRCYSSNNYFLDDQELKLKSLFQECQGKSAVDKLKTFKLVVDEYKTVEAFFNAHSLPPLCFRDSKLLYYLSELFLQIWEELPKLNKDPEIRQLLKYVFIFTNKGEKKCVLDHTLSQLHINNLNHKKCMTFVPLQQVGFLVPKDDTLSISEDWVSVIESLECEVESVLFLVLGESSKRPINTPEYEYCQKFFKGPDLLRFPRFFVHQAVQRSDLIMERLVKLNPEQFRIVAPIIDNVILSTQRLVQFLKVAHEGFNHPLIEICNQKLAKQIAEKLTGHRNYEEGVVISEKVFMTIIKLMPDHLENPKLDLTKFQGMTKKVVVALMKKYLTLELIGTDDKSDSGDPGKFNLLVSIAGKHHGQS